MRPKYILDMLEEVDPDWRDHFPDEDSAAAFYGISEQIEYDEVGLPELDFNED